MQPLPVPCPADLIPDATGMVAFEAAYRQAKEQDAVFVAIESLGGHWTEEGVGDARQIEQLLARAVADWAFRAHRRKPLIIPVIIDA
ncbi:hypothetical protein [Streptomyces sp. NPDC059168]|uniref:hypothetical protein n=1 Tax=Streptomyces sp. NPDC059168 TaxID=3346753 RepID=UPI0036794963